MTLRIATDSIDVPDAASWPEMHHGLKDEQFPRSSVLPMAHLLDRILPTLRSVIVTNTEEPNHYIDEDGVLCLEPSPWDEEPSPWDELWNAICMLQEERDRHRP
jgi:hypothetical protein